MGRMGKGRKAVPIERGCLLLIVGLCLALSGSLTGLVIGAGPAGVVLARWWWRLMVG